MAGFRGPIGYGQEQLFLGCDQVRCETIYRSAAHITVLSPGFRNELISRGIASGKVSVIYNWCDEESLTGRRSPNNEPVLKRMAGKFNITFAGNLGIAQSLETVLEAAGYLEKELPEIQFNFIGEGTDKTRLQKLAVSKGLRNVLFFQRLDPNPLTALEGDAADLVRKADAGLVCPPDSSREMARCAARFYGMSADVRLAMGRNGRRFYQSELGMARGISEFERVFSEVTHQIR